MKTYPKKVQNILNSFNENLDTYKECNRMIKELKKIGWEADFYLDGELFNIKKIKNQ